MEDMAESLYKRDAATLEKFSNRVCTKWAEACPSKTPKTYLHPNEHFMPLDEEMWRMRRMQDVINSVEIKISRRVAIPHRSRPRHHRVHTTYCLISTRTTTFQSVSSSSIIARTPRTFTALTTPVPICLIPISHTSNGSLSPG